MPGMGLLQPWHLLLILLIVLIVFGAGKLGQVGGALGQSVREFKSTVGDEDDENKAKGVAVVDEAPAVEARATTTKVVRPSEPVTIVRTTERQAESLRREEI